jgi:hypothetical protein
MKAGYDPQFSVSRALPDTSRDALATAGDSFTTSGRGRVRNVYPATDAQSCLTEEAPVGSAMRTRGQRAGAAWKPIPGAAR